MTISSEQLKQLTALAYLNPNSATASKLILDINAIVDFVAQLAEVNTTEIQPLMHPIDSTQRLRADIPEPCQLNQQLANVAPLFKDNLYLVPKVLKGTS